MNLPDELPSVEIDVKPLPPSMDSLDVVWFTSLSAIALSSSVARVMNGIHDKLLLVLETGIFLCGLVPFLAKPIDNFINRLEDFPKRIEEWDRRVKEWQKRLDAGKN